MVLLKKSSGLTLQSLADQLGITKMGAYKHLVKLEERGLVARTIVKKSVGRPSFRFTLTDKGKRAFHSSFIDTLDSLVNYVDRTQGKEVVYQFLKERYCEVMRSYTDKLGGLNTEQKIAKLVAIRTEEGYMAELRRGPKKMYELLEYNCPIFLLAKRHTEACSFENQLFSALLGVEVENTHRQVEGKDVCRFLVRLGVATS